VFVLLPKRL